MFYPVFCTDRKHNDADAIFEDAPSIEMPPLALTTQMLSCYLFAIYAYHFQMWTLFIPNSFGFVFGFLWSTLYPFKVSPEFGFMKHWRIQYASSMFAMALGSLSVHNYPYVSSSIAATIGVMMCSYPITAMHQAITESNPNYLGSQSMNIAMLTCCSAWVIHSSLVEFDAFVLLANAAGVLTQGVALIIRYIIARKAGGMKDEEAPLL